MNARYQARRLGPATANIVDTDTGYHTVDLFVGADAMSLAQDRAEALNRPHIHDLIESGMTDSCNHGCKIFRCSCGESEIRHMASYGCPIGRGDVAA